MKISSQDQCRIRAVMSKISKGLIFKREMKPQGNSSSFIETIGQFQLSEGENRTGPAGSCAEQT